MFKDKTMWIILPPCPHKKCDLHVLITIITGWWPVW